MSLSKFRVFFLIFLVSSAFIFCSCRNPQSSSKISVGKDFYYWPATEESTIADAMANYENFQMLKDNTTRNLEHVLGREACYVWVRAEFTIPEEFKNQTLGLVVPYLRFAEMLWINQNFTAMHGSFPPRMRSNLYSSIYYNFPPDVLNQEGTNTIYIKIYSHGQSAISTHSYIKPARYAHAECELINFAHSRIYLLFIGGLFFTFLLYLILYISQKKKKEHLDFSLLNFCTILLLTPFFAPEVPWYTASNIPYLLFMKINLCIPIYWIFYFISSFIMDFEHSIQIPFIKKIRLAMTIGQTCLTMILPDYDTLMDSTVPMLLFSIIQLCFGLYAFSRNLFIKMRRKRAVIQLLGFTPVLVSILIDLGLRLYDNTTVYPFFTIFGWQATIIAFIIILSVNYSRVYNQNEVLTTHLQEEVALRTLELQDTNFELSKLNDQLESDRIRSEIDLEMASIVQKKFFPDPVTEFKGWELAVCYEPLSKVSGDLYDYYAFGQTLNGFSLFDVSGHGISASLITMLSKNIIGHAFQKGFKEKEQLSLMLHKINRLINEEKGQIDNYLTGILCRFENFVPDGSLKIELGNAGHPYPILYSSDNNRILTLAPDNSQPHCGAIGMQGVNVAFPIMNFTMNTNDIFVGFTDGLIEGTNPDGEQYGRQRVEQILMQNSNKKAEEIVEAIKNDLNGFAAGKPREDDLTIIVLKRKNPEYLPDTLDVEELIPEV